MLRIIDNNNKVIKTYNLKFTKRNVEKLAYQYDAEVIKIESGTATLKDNRDRLLFVDEVSERLMNKLKESTWGGMGTSYPFPDDGSGVSGDDDRPPGNILIGDKYKETDFFNKLTTFSRNWIPDAGEWKWDHFENAGGMEDYDNYSQSLQAMKSLFPEETWDNVWKRMTQVSDKQASKDFAKAGQPHRDASSQIGKDDVIVALPPEQIQTTESLLDRIEKIIL